MNTPFFRRNSQGELPPLNSRNLTPNAQSPKISQFTDLSYMIKKRNTHSPSPKNSNLKVSNTLNNSSLCDLLNESYSLTRMQNSIQQDKPTQSSINGTSLSNYQRFTQLKLNNQVSFEKIRRPSVVLSSHGDNSPQTFNSQNS